MATPPRRRSRAHSKRAANSPQHRRRAFVAVERLWGRLADLLGAGPTKATTPTFTLAPRRLEPRRMLDAAGAAMALETVAVSTAFTATSDDAAATPPVANLNGNTAPSDIEIQTPIIIDENGVATLALAFTDPDLLDTHTIEVDWQDGSTQTFSLAAGVTSFSTTHQYLDDNLPGPATEDYDVTVKVTDSAGEFAEETSKITVLNVAPSNLQVAPIAPINENGVATLNLSFDDPGTLDDHTVEVDWGDGSAVQVFTVPTGDRNFSATHQYLDDNPTGTASDQYTVKVRLADDDLGETTATAVAKVNNVAPFNVQIQSIMPVNENGVASLAIGFNDPETLDSHTVEVDWGDGTVETISLAVGARNLTANHQYLDDNPTGTPSDVYTVKVRVLDDDLGEGSSSKTVTVVNVAPSNVQINPIAPIDENGVAVLKLTFDDPGTLDSHTVEVDWGDGTVETIAVAAGSRTFTANHQYLDDNPSGTSADNYTVSVKVRDDDGGEATGNATAKVLNVPPGNVVVTPVATITNEGTQVNLGIKFDDPGSQDTHQVEINWGDGNVTTATAVGHTLNANHTYGDNGTYAVIVKVIDDDGGAGFGSAAVQVNSVAPSNVQINPIAAIDENGVASLTLTFDDPGTLDTHTVEVNWGDGTIETLNVTAGARTFTATHQYLDDNPTATLSDVYTVNVKVRDDDGGQATASQTVTVSNVAPSNVQINPIVAINEDGVASLTLTFDDPGTLDTHTVEVNWGDGTVETLAVTAGSRTFTATHQYLDDNPTATSSDVYTVNVKVRDDDGGQATSSQTVTVSNVAPSNVQINPITAIDENGVASLTLTFNDPGTLDTHTVEVNWGDGTVETLNVAPGARTFTATHQYLDDNPTATSSDVYTVNVKVRDDDGGQATASQTVTVSNVAPSNVQINPIVAINENGVASLTLTFDDPGTLDSHTVEVNWGDGSAVEVFTIPTGDRTFTATHQYLDDNPTGTAADVYTVSVKVRDDDGGQATASQTVTVSNVAPSNVQINPIVAINENGVASLTLTFDDPGTLDTHTVEVNWGDGTVETLNVTAGTRTLSATHQYLDDNPTATSSDVYTVNVKVRDDDGGQVTGSQTVTVSNIAPSNVQINPIVAINENGVASLTLTFDDPGTLDTHTVEVNWGDGTVETLNVTAGARTFTATHQYLDDNPTATSSDVYTVNVKVRDDDGGQATASQTVTVSNVAPSNVQINPITTIDENGVASLTLTFDDPGTLDSHMVEVDWGDGTVETLNVTAGARTFTATHQYLDDNPTATSSDVYAVNVKVRDDDGGQATASSTVEVLNVAPGNVVAAPVGSIIDEGGGVTLDVTFDDPGSQDTHQVEIIWGDGHVTTGTATGHTFNASHVYADNGAYAVSVKVIDDDGGVGNGSAAVMVANVAPSVTVVGPQTVNEGALLSLTNIGQFTDPGFNNPLNAGNILNGGETTEEFEYEINWGDGSAAESGVPTIDQVGGAGVATAGSFDGSHIYADNGVYTVTVTVKDDDGGVTVKQFQVTVQNVDPTLTFTNPTIVVNEGAPITLAGLGVGAADPGFDNDALGTKETFEGATVDWGDGSTADPLTVSVGVEGSAGNPTTGVFAHAAHHYADNGTYTVTVSFKDDDGAVVDRTFTIVVENVAPSLELTPDAFVINEGETLNLPNLGTFSDPGFNNANNPNGASQESFHYTINWGDGTADEEGELPASVTNGSPGVVTIGTLANSHFYADNDVDNKYTITVTLKDDDGGTITKTIEVTVLNVNPTLNPIVATDVNTKGETTLTLQFDDPGADEFDIVVDWGDTVETIHVPANSKGQPLTYSHTYSGPPDPLNPTADITITVQILDDDFNTGALADGASNVETVDISQPGLGAEKFRIDTSPQVAILTFPDRQVVPLLQTSTDVRLVTVTTGDDGGGGGDTRAASERFLELRVINPDGTEGPGYRLPAKVLNNLPALFRNLPDNHYKIYLVQSETNAKRLVIEVFVRNGKLIDPGDDSEGARDRPPTEEATTRPIEEQPAAVPSDEAAPPVELPADPQTSLDGRLRPRSSSAICHSATLAGVAIALSGAGKNSFHKLEEALARAKPDQWKRLRSAGTPRPKKPR